MYQNNLLDEINKKKTLTIKEILDKLKKSSFFFLLFLVTLLTSIPSWSWGFGLSTVPGGIISLIISIQIMLGYNHIYLPKFLENINIKCNLLKKVLGYISIFKIKNSQLEKTLIENPLVTRISAMFILLNSILMMIPLLLTNWLPSLSVTFISISHIFKNTKLLMLCYILTIPMLLGYIYAFILLKKYGIENKDIILEYFNNILEYFNNMLKNYLEYFK